MSSPPSTVASPRVLQEDDDFEDWLDPAHESVLSPDPTAKLLARHKLTRSVSKIPKHHTMSATEFRNVLTPKPRQSQSFHNDDDDDYGLCLSTTLCE